MSKEINLQEIIDATQDSPLAKGHLCVSEKFIKDVAREAIRQALAIAAKDAKTEKVSNSGSWLDAKVNKESITNVINKVV